MAMKAAARKGCSDMNAIGGFFSRFTHSLAIPPSFNYSIQPISEPSPFSIPEPHTPLRPQFPSFSSHLGSMDLMAVPKKKVSKHKRGIRNGPKALKPTPVIVRCTLYLYRSMVSLVHGMGVLGDRKLFKVGTPKSVEVSIWKHNLPDMTVDLLFKAP